MSIAARQLVVVLGPSYAGLVGKVTLTVFDLSGTAVIGPTTAGIVEDAALPGTYYAAPAFDSRWAGRVEWTIAGIPGVGGIDDFGAVLGATRQIVAALGGDNSGLVGQVGYTVYDTTGAVLVARTTAGIAESAALPGSYCAAVFLAASWTGRVAWDVSRRPLVRASEEFGPGIAGVPFASVTAPERPDAPERQP